MSDLPNKERIEKLKQLAQLERDLDICFACHLETTENTAKGTFWIRKGGTTDEVVTLLTRVPKSKNDEGLASLCRENKALLVTENQGWEEEAKRRIVEAVCEILDCQECPYSPNDWFGYDWGQGPALPFGIEHFEDIWGEREGEKDE